MSNNNDYATSNLLAFAYFKKNYRLIAINFSKQTKLKDPQQISFIGKLLNTRGATIPANIHLDEDVLKTSFSFVFRIRLQDVLTKTNIFTLHIRHQKTSSRRLDQEQYILLGHTSSRHLQDVSRRLHDIFKTSC